MSSIYSLEPNTSGRLVFQTSHGPVIVGLWVNQCPNGARRFLQAAVDQQYTDSVFDRVVPGALVQLGSAKDAGNVENHGRLKFRRRGLVAMVGSGNAFFITLAATPWLDGKHTIIGEVQGKTIFNVLTLADTAQNAEDGAKPRVHKVIVEENPCPDIVPTQVSRPVSRNENCKDNTVAVRDRRLLSFAHTDDDEEESEPTPKRVKKSVFPSAIPQSTSEAEVQEQLRLNDDLSGKTKKPCANCKAAGAEAQIAQLLAKVRTKRQPKKSTARDENSNGARGSNDVNPQLREFAEDTGKFKLASGGRRRRETAREAEVLRKLVKFEKQLTAARSSEGGGESDAWYAAPLILSASHETSKDEDEYEVVEGALDDSETTGAGKDR